MDFENLQTMDKSEFLPLGTVKQELLDAANGITNDADATEKTIQINSDDSETVEATNPVCDSAEKQVNYLHVNILWSSLIASNLNDFLLILTSSVVKGTISF